MQQQVHYSVSIHAASSRTVTAQQPAGARSDVLPRVPSSTACTTRPAATTEQYARPADILPPQNGFKAIKDAARRDFFTIRADAVQDGVLAMLDSLAEYLVWDGMDRRLRAVASATHTEHPEAVVSVQQIANDIKVRVGHDLCERTIERALKKLCDVGLLSASARFHQGRRQASSYMLLYAPSMSSRLENSRRGGNPKPPATSDTPLPGPYQTHASDIPHSANTSLTRIGDRIPAFPAHPVYEEEPVDVRHSSGGEVATNGSGSAFYEVQPTIDQEVAHESSGHHSSARPPQTGENDQPSECRQEVRNQSASPTRSKVEDMDARQGPTTSQPPVCRSAHSAEGVTNRAVPGETERSLIQTTSVSPLFNKEKENKKVFKNVFSISEFSKNNPTPKPSQNRPDGNGYFLDSVHKQGWVSAEDPKLLDYLGDLSRYAFFTGHRTLDALSSWFQGMENNIADNRTTLEETLRTAGIPVSDAPITRHEPVKMSEIRFGC
ncbi:MAG: hypothetical protein ACYCRF_08085 [Acidithiobacillus sp.]